MELLIGTTGNKLADDIFALIQQSDSIGMSRTEISNAFNRNKKASELDAAFKLLLDNSMIEGRMINYI